MAKKKRTSIRTAAGTTQEAFKTRIQALVEDPMRVMPTCPEGDPAPVAKIRKAIARISAKGPTFFDRRDKGIVGGVAHALPLADITSFPRLLDARVAGRRRFFLQRGHVSRGISLGVQNHDDPRALLLAWRDFAKKHTLHFFASPELWCLQKPEPPAQWWAAFGKRIGADLREESPGIWGDGRSGARVELRFHGGPAVRIAKADEHAHLTISAFYAGPRQRQPVGVAVQLPDGTLHEPKREDIAAYRAQVMDERDLIAKSLAAWRAGDATRFVIGETVHPDQASFLEALSPEPWEREAIAAMTRTGHQGEHATVAAVLEAHKEAMIDGVGALISNPAAFIQSHNVPPRELLRLAHEEALRQEALAGIPTLTGLGPVGAFLDHAERHRRVTGDAIAPARHALDQGVAPQHVAAWLEATGGLGELAVRFDDDSMDAGRALSAHVEPLLGAERDAYQAALNAYLRESGSGERA